MITPKQKKNCINKKISQQKCVTPPTFLHRGYNSSECTHTNSLLTAQVYFCLIIKWEQLGSAGCHLRVGPRTGDIGLVPWNQEYLEIVPWDWVVGEACSARRSECSFISKLYSARTSQMIWRYHSKKRVCHRRPSSSGLEYSQTTGHSSFYQEPNNKSRYHKSTDTSGFCRLVMRLCQVF